jgi:hypothetical protein
LKKNLLYIILLVTFESCALVSLAQNMGITTPGTTNYPQTTIGNTLTEASGNAGNFLIFDPVTTTVPLTAIAIKTFGSVNGTISVTIYNDNGGTPGTKLFTEVASSVTANALSSITIPNTFLPAGNYWLAYDMNSGSSTANFITKSTGVTGYVRKSMALTYGGSFPNNPAVNNLATGNQDHIAFAGVPIQGYVKATKASVPINASFTAVNFYSHAAGNVRLAIYSDNGSGTAPLTKKWESGDISISATGQPKLTTVNISSGTPTTLNLTAGTYWLAWQWNSANSGPSISTGAANTGNFIVQSYGAFPLSWTGGTTSTENWTEYATFSCTQPAPPTVPNKGTCTGAAATITASGAVSGDKYKWYDAASGGTLLKTSTDNNDNSFTTVALTSTTNYWVSIINSSACESNRTQVTVSINPSPVASVTGQSNINCFAASDGTITIQGNNGTGPYNYSVDNGANWTASAPVLPNPYTFTGLQANQAYKIRVRDANGCLSKSVQ